MQNRVPKEFETPSGKVVSFSRRVLLKSTSASMNAFDKRYLIDIKDVLLCLLTVRECLFNFLVLLV
jgi:hypothetical protein